MLTRITSNLSRVCFQKTALFSGTTPIRCVSYIDRSIIPVPIPSDDNPERDYVNFPRPKRVDYCPPVRFLFIPEHWFQKMYPKMGNTGPYTLALGFTALLFSKEFMLTTHHSNWHLVGCIWWVYVASITPLKDIIFGFFYNKETLDSANDNIKAWDELPKVHEKAIAHEKHEQWRAEGERLIYAVKRDNIAMQLEATYRERAMRLFNAVKKRLDYQVEVANVYGRVQQRFMTDWVIEKVKASITQQQERDTLKKCISDLQMLAARV